MQLEKKSRRSHTSGRVALLLRHIFSLPCRTFIVKYGFFSLQFAPCRTACRNVFKLLKKSIGRLACKSAFYDCKHHCSKLVEHIVFV